MLGSCRAKIARAENNCHDLSTMAKKVGSNYTLLNRQLFCQFKKGFAEVFSFVPPLLRDSNSCENPQMWTRGESNPFLLHAMEAYYRCTTGPLNLNSKAPLFKIHKRISILGSNLRGKPLLYSDI